MTHATENMTFHCSTYVVDINPKKELVTMKTVCFLGFGRGGLPTIFYVDPTLIFHARDIN